VKLVDIVANDFDVGDEIVRRQIELINNKSVAPARGAVGPSLEGPGTVQGWVHLNHARLSGPECNS
jgi:hypothetical protein